MFATCITSTWKWEAVGKKSSSSSFFFLDLTWGQRQRPGGFLTMTFPARRPSTYPAVPHLPHPKLGGSGVSLWNTGWLQTSALNRAAVLSGGPLMDSQDWDQGQIVCEENEGWRLLQWGAVRQGLWCLHRQMPQRVDVCADAQLAAPHLECVD